MQRFLWDKHQFDSMFDENCSVTEIPTFNLHMHAAAGSFYK